MPLNFSVTWTNCQHKITPGKNLGRMLGHPYMTSATCHQETFQGSCNQLKRYLGRVSPTKVTAMTATVIFCAKKGIIDQYFLAKYPSF